MSSAGDKPRTRILVVHSTIDESTDRRIWSMQSRADALGIELSHLSILGEDYAAIVAEGYPTTSFPENKPSTWIRNHERLILERLSALIRKASPDYLLLHTGVAFMFAPETILRIIAALKSRHPDLICGIQPGKTLDMTIGESPASVASDIDRLFDQSPRTRELVEALFP
jgi:hypothetical protein